MEVDIKQEKEVNEETKLSQVILKGSKKEDKIVLEPKEIDIDENKFDERFKNRKSRRQFMKMLNNKRVLRFFKIEINKNTGKKFKKWYVEPVIDKEGKVSPKINWSLMPKFTKELSEQYSENCGIVKGWREKNFIQKSTKKKSV